LSELQLLLEYSEIQGERKVFLFVRQESSIDLHPGLNTVPCLPVICTLISLSAIKVTYAIFWVLNDSTHLMQFSSVSIIFVLSWLINIFVFYFVFVRICIYSIVYEEWALVSFGM
jgi:hypothetical protein